MTTAMTVIKALQVDKQTTLTVLHVAVSYMIQAYRAETGGRFSKIPKSN